MDLSFLLTRAALLIPFIFALSVHECAHAWAALMLGDDTAQRMGRLTLNPVVHVHPIGTLLLPLLGVPFGWARSVPVDPSRFGPQVTLGTGVLLTSLAGPMSNLALALLSGVVLRGADALQATLPDFIGRFMEQLIQINVALALFNLLPFPPLDGGRVVEGLIPFEWRWAWDRFSRVGIFLLVGALVASQLLGLNPAGGIAVLSRALSGR